MGDKKVERNIRSSGEEVPIAPKEKLQTSLSESGNVNMADPVHDKGKSALLDRFREREERYRQEQSSRDKKEAQEGSEEEAPEEEE